MIKTQEIAAKKISDLLDTYPFLDAFLEENMLDVSEKGSMTLDEFFNSFDEEEVEDKALDKDRMVSSMAEYINRMIEFLGAEEEDVVKSVTILPGTDKSGNKETFDSLTIKQSEIICIVGPTGSGKSRLLADIEWTAQKDTPTSRSILINEQKPDMKWRFSSSNKLVAQLSQNMNFVMDLTVKEFLELHANSRMVENEQEVIARIIEAANNLAGEKFDVDTPVTSLSGGQSRALMIADTAILSKSPIILIDEIENAGIDRKKALQLLVGEEKIVFMATHDPMLALMGDKRIVIRNGGIDKVIETSPREKELLEELEKIDNLVQTLRAGLRSGEQLNVDHPLCDNLRKAAEKNN
jgi:ABC-type lipoprotein export system ATPase subunit